MYNGYNPVVTVTWSNHLTIIPWPLYKSILDDSCHWSDKHLLKIAGDFTDSCESWPSRSQACSCHSQGWWPRHHRTGLPWPKTGRSWGCGPRQVAWHKSMGLFGSFWHKCPSFEVAVCQNLVPLVNIKIAGKWMFIPLKMVLIGIDPYPCFEVYMGRIWEMVVVGWKIGVCNF